MSPSLRSLVFSAVGIALGLSLGVLGVVAVSRLVGPLPLSVNSTVTNKMSTFDVTGESKITTVPDKVVVSLGITVNESSVKTAQDTANRIMNDINSELGKLGIEKKDIKTDNYSLFPNYDYSTGTQQQISGYTVTANLSVSIADFAKLNQAIDAATTAGANQVGGINFTLSDDKKKEVENEARKEAIEHAKTKAQDLSRLAGMRLGKIVNIYESQPYNGLIYSDISVMPRVEDVGGGAPTNIEPGSTTYNFTVILSYETL